MKTEKPFVRENRYIVFKLRDITNARTSGVLSLSQQGCIGALQRMVDQERVYRGKSPLECVVVEKDWPEYELVWALIEARVASEGSFDAQAKIKKTYYEALSVLHGLAGRTEKPAS